MKTLSEIYKSIRDRFKSKTNIDVTEGTVIDSYILASSTALEEAYIEIENSKNPHIYTNLKGTNIDKMALLLNCPRYANESDDSYLYRCMHWTLLNESSNSTAIECALSNLEYSSNATYVPYTEGTGSATVFLIPKVYEDDTITRAIDEAKNRLTPVISPDTYIHYMVSTPIATEVYVYMSFVKGSDEKAIKNNLQIRIKEYINSIPIGSTLSYGEINKIGLQERGVSFFNATHIRLDGELLTALSKIQTVESKFLYSKINWTVVNE